MTVCSAKARIFPAIPSQEDINLRESIAAMRETRHAQLWAGVAEVVRSLPFPEEVAQKIEISPPANVRTAPDQAGPADIFEMPCENERDFSDWINAGNAGTALRFPYKG